MILKQEHGGYTKSSFKFLFDGGAITRELGM